MNERLVDVKAGMRMNDARLSQGGSLRCEWVEPRVVRSECVAVIGRD